MAANKHRTSLKDLAQELGVSIATVSRALRSSPEIGQDMQAKVKALANAADSCWTAIMNMDLTAFATAYRDSFEAQTAMFPAMIQGEVQAFIDRYAALPPVLAWKMPGAGGGGYLALVVDDASEFLNKHPEAIMLTIRRPGF